MHTLFSLLCLAFYNKNKHFEDTKKDLKNVANPVPLLSWFSATVLSGEGESSSVKHWIMGKLRTPNGTNQQGFRQAGPPELRIECRF